MKILTLLFLSFSGLITHTSFACSKELLKSPDYSQELSKEIAKAPVFYIEKNTFNELIHNLTNGSLWSYILLNHEEINNHLRSTGFSLLNFLETSPSDHDEPKPISTINIYPYYDVTNQLPPFFFFALVSTITPTFNITYNTAKTKVEKCERGPDIVREQPLKAFGSIFSLEQ